MKVTPVRLQRKRIKGYDIQAVSQAANGLPCIVVTRPSRWGNPYDVGLYGRELSLVVFRNTIRGVWDPGMVQGQSPEESKAIYAAHCAFLKRLGAHPLEIIETELGGSNLGCYCALEVACHADTLLFVANPNQRAR